MRSASTGNPPPLPETLLDDLGELLSWDNNCFLTWVAVTDAGADGSNWFTVRLSSDRISFGLKLEFWIPEWMTARGVEAILPAHLAVAECIPGECAAVDLGMQSWASLRSSLPRVARTCARLINELWGPTESDQVLLMTLEYQDERLEVAFSELPTYGK